MRGEIEEDEAILWTVMILEFTKYMVEDGVTFRKLEVNCLLHKLGQASIADFAKVSRANVSDQMKKFGIFVRNMAVVATDRDDL